MKQISRTLIRFITLLALVSLACGGTGTTVNVPQVTIPQGGVPQATLDAASTQAAILAGQADSAAATTQANVAQQATQAVPAAATSGVAVDGVATIAPTLETAVTQLVPTLAAANYTMADLEAMFSTIQPDGSGNMTVTITDDQLTSAVAAAQSTGQGAGQIQNVTFTFVPGAILMSGDVTQPIQARLTVTFSPYITNGVLQFDVTQASLGNIQVPPAMLDQAEATLNTSLGTAASQLPANVTLQTVTIGEGVMTFTAGLN
ncbi:MAG: hypothetical protein KA314_01420 [Chloroflexi bacterium]|nr:hypothetical protein [Chloroflexota bacterium]MBP8054467.1 hypothetical protein [Chloroflexota bacterium]